MVDKRDLESGASAPDSKRPRVEGSSNGATGTAAPKPSISLEALEKAKQALQRQKQIQEKLKSLPQLAKLPGASGATVNPAAVAGMNPVLAAATQKAAEIARGFGGPPPTAAGLMAYPGAALPSTTTKKGFQAPLLRVDERGREVDEFGRVITPNVMQLATLKVNQQLQSLKEQAKARAAQVAAQAVAPPEEPVRFFDPEIGTRPLKKLERRRRPGFEFVQEGTFLKQAELGRLRARYGDNAGRKPMLPRVSLGPSEDPNKIPIDPNKMPLGKRGPKTEEGPEELDAEDQGPLPDAEWWDKNLLANGSYAEDVGDDVALKENKVTHLVEHPVPIEPPAEAPPPPPQPLKLTKKELKKLRTQRRQAREKEKQELMRQGLLEAPKPRVRIANMMRVLGEQAAADPTAIEQEVRKQMVERQTAHEDRNLARKLTDKERRDKKLRKLFDDNGVDSQVAVYKVSSPALAKAAPLASHRGKTERDEAVERNRFKVGVNATENHLKGMCLVTPDFSIVVVEGCNKSLKRYNKLMLRRIDWNEVTEDAMDDDNRPVNSCDLVWTGVVKKPAFKKFTTEDCSAENARKLLEDHGVAHYWDTAASFVPGETLAVEL